MVFDESKDMQPGTFDAAEATFGLADMALTVRAAADIAASGVAELDIAYQRLLAALQITMDAARAGDAEKYQVARAYVDKLHAQLHAEKTDLFRTELDAEELDE